MYMQINALGQSKRKPLQMDSDLMKEEEEMKPMPLPCWS